MKNMLKTITALFIGVLCIFGCIAQIATKNSPPVFSRGALIDTSTVGGGFNKIEFYNLCDCLPYTLNIYGFDDNSLEWVFCGTVFLKGYKDSDDIEHIEHIPGAKNIGLYRYFGVESSATVPLAFGESVLKKNGHIYITITNGDVLQGSATSPVNVAPPSATSTALDTKIAFGDFLGSVIDTGASCVLDKIEFKDLTHSSPHTLGVYVSDEKKEQWTYIGGVFLKHYQDDCDIDKDNMFFSGTVRYIGIIDTTHTMGATNATQKQKQSSAELKYSLEPAKSDKAAKPGKHGKKKNKVYILVTQ